MTTLGGGKIANGRRVGGPRHGPIALVLALIVAGMVGMSFAAVPLYRIFCQVTGYGGTTQRADKGVEAVLERTITVRFDGNVASGMAWDFHPVQRQMVVKIGETAIAHFQARNLTARTITGTATFNVTPESVGSYFNKIECFCFSEQVLKGGATADLPVTFFIDPAIVEDADVKDVTQVTLAYTFFPSAAKAPKVAATGGGKGS